MVYGRRKHQEELAAAEAEGRSFWTETLDPEVRHRLLYAVENLSEGMDGSLGNYSMYGNESFDLVGRAQRLTLQELGKPTLADEPHDARKDGLTAIVDAEKDIVFSFLEAVLRVAIIASQGPSANHTREEAEKLKERLPTFVKTIKTVLREHRVSFDLVGGVEFIPFESREMHEAVVIPTLTLLGGRRDLAGVEKAYRDALDEIHKGKPENAITDAGTALQEALVALGCDGNALGPLAKSARTKGLISAHDKKLIDWVSADRSTMGDAHNVQPASTEDAWLAVHVVGAIILRITGGPPRSSQ